MNFTPAEFELLEDAVIAYRTLQTCDRFRELNVILDKLADGGYEQGWRRLLKEGADTLEKLK